jgi:hypothetical protein
VDSTAEGAHRAVERNVAVPPVDGVPLPGKWEPDEGLRFRIRSGSNSEHERHPWLLGHAKRDARRPRYISYSGVLQLDTGSSAERGHLIS